MVDPTDLVLLDAGAPPALGFGDPPSIIQR